jgi:hypothetical protein
MMGQVSPETNLIPEREESHPPLITGGGTRMRYFVITAVAVFIVHYFHVHHDLVHHVIETVLHLFHHHHAVKRILGA